MWIFLLCDIYHIERVYVWSSSRDTLFDKTSAKPIFKESFKFKVMKMALRNTPEHADYNSVLFNV